MRGPRDLLITGATVLTLDPGRPVIEGGAVLCRGDLVHWVGPAKSLPPSPADRPRQTLDASGCLVLPGLINTHAHLFQNLLKGLGDALPLEEWWPKVIGPAAAALTPEDAAAAAEAGALEALRSGTTTIVDFMYANANPGNAGAVIEAVRKVGLRIVLARGFRDTGAELGFPGSLIERPDDAFTHTRDLAARARREHGALARVWLAPTAIWGLSREGLKASREFADATGTRLTMHVWETPTDDAICGRRYGKSAREVLEETGLLGPDFLAVHCVQVTDMEVALLARSSVAVSHNPMPNMMLAAGVMPLRKLLRAGVRVALGTDGAASNNTVDMLEVLKTTVLLHRVASGNPRLLLPEEALAMATVAGAAALGDPSLGSIRPGLAADLVVYNPNVPRSSPLHQPASTLVFAPCNRGVRDVVVGGRVVLEGGSPSLVRESRVLARQQTAAVDLCRRAGLDSLRSLAWRSPNLNLTRRQPTKEEE